MNDTLAEYAFTVHLDTPYEQARERIETALKEQGFGIITEIDIRQTFKVKLDRDFRKYAILGACNPNLAIQALGAEPQVGLLLPCNVIVYEDDDGAGSTVSVVDPLGMLGDIDTPELRAVADDAHARLSLVAEALAS
ncbi:MAG: DUF302 domain-containing protein [Chloroflexota bacterium]|jgi:uncharacterized protein (DUF302 family)